MIQQSKFVQNRMKWRLKIKQKQKLNENTYLTPR